MTRIEKELQELGQLEGLIPNELGRALYGFAYGIAPYRRIVELGSYKGKSTCYLAAGARAGAGARVVAIDPWDLPGNPAGKHGYRSSRPAFNAQVESMGLTDRITPVQGFSTEVASRWNELEGNATVELLYIDGDHEEKPVRDDFLAWEGKLTRRAHVLFDDFDTPRNPGVRRAIESLQDRLTPPVVLAGRLAWCRWRGPQL